MRNPNIFTVNPFLEVVERLTKIEAGNEFIDQRFYEIGNNYSIFIKMPGCDKRDIKLAFTDKNKINIKCELKEICGIDISNIDINTEYDYTVIIPFNDADIENISARCENGILALIVPKKQRKEISIKIE